MNKNYGYVIADIYKVSQQTISSFIIRMREDRD